MVNAWQNRAFAQCELKPWNLCRSSFTGVAINSL